MGMSTGYQRIAEADIPSYRYEAEEDDETALEPEDYMYLEKTWDLVHYALTGRSAYSGRADEVSWAIVGREILAREDGMAGINDSATVRKIVRALARYTLDDIRSGLDPVRLKAADAQVRRFVANNPDAVDHVWQEFCQLRDFYGATPEAVFVTMD